MSGIAINNNIVFYNTTEEPLWITRLGYFYKSNSRYFELVEKGYHHPESINAVVKVIVPVEITFDPMYINFFDRHLEDKEALLALSEIK